MSTGSGQCCFSLGHQLTHDDRHGQGLLGASRRLARCQQGLVLAPGLMGCYDMLPQAVS